MDVARLVELIENPPPQYHPRPRGWHEDDQVRDECGVFGVFGHPEAARLTYLGVARALADLAGDDHEARARYLLRILERDPFDERAHLDLVALLARDGRHGEARRRYRLYSRRMDEIDVEAAPYPAPRHGN